MRQIRKTLNVTEKLKLL